jgi:hypothetical protein
MNRDALVVGINRYPFLKDSSTREAQYLTTAAKDAEAVACLLETHGNFRVRRFPESLIDGRLQVDPMKRVTMAQLEDAIEQLFLPEGERIPEVALLYFAGHGFRHKPTGGILQGYLGTSEANPTKEIWGVSLKRIQDILRKSPVKQQIILLDCCKSGELFNFAPENLGDSDKVRFFVTAAREFEDAHSKKNEHGALTEILLKGLDPSAKGVVTSLTLSKFINQQLLQVPQKPITYCDERLPIYLTATPEKKHLLEQPLGKRQVSPKAMMRDGGTLSRQEYRNRQILLSRVKNEVNIGLEESLRNAVLINLGKEKQPEQVKCPCNIHLKVGNSSTVRLPPELTTIDVFDDKNIAGNLLILGAPGSGKTTTLLELTRGLIERAEFDANEPMPILFNLSSWKDDKQSIAQWLVAELKDKHGFRKDIGEKWLNEHEVLPLLDGLDELASERQEKCVVAINLFLESELRPLNLVVCSRKEEYELYETQLQLNGAIYLEPLNKKDIRQNLENLGLTQLWRSIQSSSVILDTINKPLFFNIMILAYQQISIKEWLGCNTPQKCCDYLLGVYLVNALNKNNDKSKDNQYNNRPRIVIKCLIWLAKIMNKESLTEFSIDKLQPNCLKNPKTSSYYFFIHVLLYLGLISIFLLINSIFIKLNNTIILMVASILILTFIISFLMNLLPAYLLNFCIKSNSFILLTLGLAGGGIFTIFSIIVILLTILKFIVLNFVVMSGISIAVYVYFDTITATIVEMTVNFFHSFGFPFFRTAVITTIISLLFMGFINLIQVFTDFFAFSKIITIETVKINLKKGFLNIMSSAKAGLIGGWKIGVYIMGMYYSLLIGAIFIFGAESGPPVDNTDNTNISDATLLFIFVAPMALPFILAFIGLIITAIPTTLFELTIGFKGSEIETKTLANEGIWRSLVHAIIFSIIGGIIGWLIFGLQGGLIAALAWGLSLGGIACIKHLMMRIELWLGGCIPWNYARFLNHCTERKILQRVGGRYRFIHRLLQEHFANMELVELFNKTNSN